MATNSQGKRVLIMGGYGKAGYRLSAGLSKGFSGLITLAGRSLDKARRAVNQLQAESGDQTVLEARSMDFLNPETTAQIPVNYHLVIVACPLSDQSLNALIEGCLSHGTDYIDLIPQAAKKTLFDGKAEAIKGSSSRFILDAGAIPGLPGWLVRHTISKHPDADTLRLWGRYRSNDIGWEGVGDILDEVDSQGWQYESGWKRAPWWDLRSYQFPGGLGRGVCVPIHLAEVEDLPAQLGLHRFSFYHAGLNPVTDILMTLERTGLLNILSPRTRQSLFFNAMRRFSRPPFGLSLVAEVEHKDKILKTALWHHDLYQATVVPAALMALMLVSDPTLPPSYGYLGYWALQHPNFSGALRECGFQLDEESF